MAGTRPDNDVQSLDPRAVRALTEMLGHDREALAELVVEFVEEAPRRLAEMRSPDAVLAGRAAHTLKSNALTFGAAELAGRCRDVEIAARDGAIDPALVDLAAAAWAGAEPELARLR